MTPPSTQGNPVTHVEPTTGSLPAWFTTNRVHGHTRLTLRLWRDKDEFKKAAAGFKSLGAHAFTRHVKTGDEDPWWPTGQPPRRNVVSTFIHEAHTEGLKIFAYYWHMSEKTMADLHSEWICRDWNGNPVDTERGPFLDMTGPYRELVLTRLRELAGMGADGLFFDFRHLPPRGCLNTALAIAWEARTGAPPPAPNDCDSLYLDFLDFKAEQIEDTFAYWRDRVKADYPNVVFIISTTTVPALTDREMTTRLARLADSAKNEYRHALHSRYTKDVFEPPSNERPCEPPVDLRKPEDHVRQALGWTVLRDAADGRPPHIWARGVPNRKHAQAFAGSLLTFGCIANMDVHEYYLSEKTAGEVIPQGKTPVDALKDAFALGNVVSLHMDETRALRWAAIHFGERSRNEYGGNFRAAWREVLWPLVGAYQALTEDGVPVGIVNDQQLAHGELDGYRVLVLPKPNGLDHGQQLAVTAFKASGGTVIENDPAWPWSDPNAGDAAADAFRAALGGHLKAAPLRVIGGPTGRYAVAYHKTERLVVAVTNDFSWVQIEWEPGAINPAPPPAAGVRVSWRKDAGLVHGADRTGRLHAIEAVTGQTLQVEESDHAYRVALPRFKFMALLVVTPAFHVPTGQSGRA